VDERLKKAAYPGLLQDHPHAHEALEYATRNDAAPNADALPLPTEQDVLTDLLRQGAKHLLAQAIQAQVSAYLEARSHLRDEAGHRQVVRNGSLPQRTILTGIGPVEAQQPRVPDRRPAGQREKFTSAIRPPYLRQTKRGAALIPWLYLKGVRTGDFSEALAALLGPAAKGLSANTVPRRKAVGQQAHQAWSQRSLAGQHYVCVGADGVYFHIRREEDRPCILVLMGATADGKKELLALSDGSRESEHSWKALLLDCQARGLSVAPTLAVGEGALGFGKALRQVFPTTTEQRCWVHQAATVLDKLPRGQQPKAQVLRHAIWQAETKAAAEKAFDLFGATYEAKYAQATDCLVKDREELLVFYAFPAWHWLHLRTTNPTEATFATVRLRTSKTKGSGSRSACLTRVFKLMESAAKRWRRLNGSPLLAKVIAGVRFVDGVEQTNAA
jgi:transposase-like protein